MKETIDLLFEETYARCTSLDPVQREMFENYLNYLYKFRSSCDAGGNDFCGTNPDESLKIIKETLLSVYDTIDKYNIIENTYDLFISKSNLSYLKRVPETRYCLNVLTHSDSPMPEVEHYELTHDLHLYDEIEEAIETVSGYYDENPIIMSRMLRHLELLFLKENKRLDGTEQNHYSKEDNWGYNHIALQLDAILGATKSLRGNNYESK